MIDGHAFEADVSVCDKVEDFLLSSDWLEKQGAQWDFANGTVTLGTNVFRSIADTEQEFVVELWWLVIA